MINQGRLASRSVTFGGLAVSLAANLLHARLLAGNGLADGYAMVGSALPPLFLLGAVEVVLSVRWKPGLWSWVVRILLGPIAGISFYLSWLHMSELVASWGASSVEAFLYPIMIDAAMLLSAGAMILEDRTPDQDADRSSEGSAVPGPLVPSEAQGTGPSPVPIIENTKTQGSPPGPGPDPEDRTPAPVPGPVVRLAQTTERTPTRIPEDPQRTTSPGTAANQDRTGPQTGGGTGTGPAPVGVSRVEQLLPIARPIVDAEPGIGWKPLATRLREAGHPIGTKTARDLRAALPDDKDGEEVSDAGGEDQIEDRDLEEAVS